jgi:hypothetical protein
MINVLIISGYVKTNLHGRTSGYFSKGTSAHAQVVNAGHNQMTRLDTAQGFPTGNLEAYVTELGENKLKLTFSCGESPGIDSVSLCSLAGRYDNPFPTRSLAPIDCSKIPAQDDCMAYRFCIPKRINIHRH